MKYSAIGSKRYSLNALRKPLFCSGVVVLAFPNKPASLRYPFSIRCTVSSYPALILSNGRDVEVVGNAGSLADAQKALKMGAAGIGLLRTEFLFLERTTAPTEAEQFEVYGSIAETMGKLPVIVRTLDVGGDKPLPYITMQREDNPFLGERGIRLCLNRPDLFRMQLRAILRAGLYGNLHIMFPMVADIEEYRRARLMLDELQIELNIPRVIAGIMIEVPSAALMADVLAKEVDF